MRKVAIVLAAMGLLGLSILGGTGPPAAPPVEGSVPTADIYDPTIVSFSAAPQAVIVAVGGKATVSVQATIRNAGNVTLTNVQVEHKTSNVSCKKDAGHENDPATTQWFCVVTNDTGKRPNDLHLVFAGKVRRVKELHHSERWPNSNDWKWRIRGTDQDNEASDCLKDENNKVDMAGDNLIGPGQEVWLVVEMCDVKGLQREVAPKKIWTLRGQELGAVTTSRWVPEGTQVTVRDTGSLNPGHDVAVTNTLEIGCLHAGTSGVQLTSEVVAFTPTGTDADPADNLAVFAVDVQCGPVGGIGEVLVEGWDAPGSAAESSDSSSPPYAALAGAAAAVVAALAAGGWYARRRWLR